MLIFLSANGAVLGCNDSKWMSKKVNLIYKGTYLESIQIHGICELLLG